MITPETGSLVRNPRYDLEKEIKKYKLDDFLVLLSEFSRDLFNSHKSYKEIEWRKPIGPGFQLAKQLLPAWALSDLSLAGIIYSNDYRPVYPKEEDIYKLNNILVGIADELAKEKRSELDSKDMRTHILFGLSQKQFWYQEIIRPGYMFYNFLRYYILLEKIPSRFFPKLRHPSADLFAVTGFDIKQFSQLLLALWSFSLTTSGLIQKITVSEDLKKEIPIITEDNIRKCLLFFQLNTIIIGDWTIPITHFSSNQLLKPVPTN